MDQSNGQQQLQQVPTPTPGDQQGGQQGMDEGNLQQPLQQVPTPTPGDQQGNGPQQLQLVQTTQVQGNGQDGQDGEGGGHLALVLQSDQEVSQAGLF